MGNIILLHYKVVPVAAVVTACTSIFGYCTGRSCIVFLGSCLTHYFVLMIKKAMDVSGNKKSG